MGILMYMSVVSLPSMRLFWKKAMNISAISKVRRYLGGGGRPDLEKITNICIT
jgi:hypothetical protein